MDVDGHTENREGLTKTVDDRECRRIRAGEYEWESRILDDDNEEVMVPVIRSERSLDVNVRAFEGLCGLNEVGVLWIVELRFEFRTNCTRLYNSSHVLYREW